MMQRTVKQEFDVILWFIACGIGLAVLVAALYHDSTAILPRTLLLTLAFGFPITLLYLWGGWNVRDVVGRNPNSVMIVASGIAALATWLISWWLMSLIQDEVIQESFSPPDIYLPTNAESVWVGLVFSDVVILPLLLMVMMWGLLVWRLQGQCPAWQVALLMGYLFGVIGMSIFGQGISGFAGYGVAGLVGGYLSALARSGWPGFTVQAIFLYANMLILDDLFRTVGTADYFEMVWMTRVIISAFVLIVSIQVVRALREPLPQAQLITTSLWSKGTLGPVVALLCATAIAFYINWP